MANRVRRDDLGVRVRRELPGGMGKMERTDGTERRDKTGLRARRERTALSGGMGEMVATGGTEGTGGMGRRDRLACLARGARAENRAPLVQRVIGGIEDIGGIRGVEDHLALPDRRVIVLAGVTAVVGKTVFVRARNVGAKGMEVLKGVGVVRGAGK
jgi:hypothetical protein